jgi:hypothetical protein
VRVIARLLRSGRIYLTSPDHNSNFQLAIEICILEQLSSVRDRINVEKAVFEIDRPNFEVDVACAFVDPNKTPPPPTQNPIPVPHNRPPQPAVIPKLFSGPSSVQALGISPTYHLPISICRTSSIIPSLIGGFHLLAPVLLNESAATRPVLSNPFEFWLIWMNLLWVSVL